MGQSNIKISASILSADLADLRNEVGRAEASGVDMLHIDVMDAIFVPPMTFGDVVVKSLGNVDIVRDVHLMVKNPTQHIKNFSEFLTEKDIITFHIESDCVVTKTLKLFESLNVRVGVAINPDTPIEDIFPYVGVVHMFTVMSVRPGYGGQAFLPETLERVATLRAENNRVGADTPILVDGGINPDTVRGVVKAGADIVVAGSYLFGSGRDMAQSVQTLRAAVSG